MCCRFSEHRSVVFLMLIFLMVMASCINKDASKEKDADTPDKQALSEALIEANKSAVESEREMIRSYAKRHKWPLEREKGIYYTVYRSGGGAAVTHGSRVVYHYSLSLINGTEVSSSSQSNPETIRVGVRGSEVGGLHRAMMLLRQGDKAKVVIPSHLAFGLAGDQKQIPSKATLIYDLHILRVE